MTIILAVVAGALLGFVLERGDMCFHATWAGLWAKPQDADLARAYGLLVLLSVPIVSTMRAVGWIDPFIPPLVWPANVIGGLVFGVGMVIASTCVSGMFYKFGHGMFGVAVAVAGWFIGDVVTYRGPLESVRGDLTDRPTTIDNDVATLDRWLGGFGVLVVVALLAVIAWHLFTSRDRPGRIQRGRLAGWVPLGIGLAGAIVVGWVLVDQHGGDYSFGTSGVPTQVWSWVRGDGGDASWWIPLALISLVPGAYIAARRSETFWARGESPRRYVQLGVGGAVMGIGAAIAGGCNLGHSMVGVPLLSLGSIVSTVAMIAGVFTADQIRRHLPTSSDL